MPAFQCLSEVFDRIHIFVELDRGVGPLGAIHVIVILGDPNPVGTLTISQSFQHVGSHTPEDTLRELHRLRLVSCDAHQFHGRTTNVIDH